MGVIKMPDATMEERADSVLVRGEVVYDTDRKLLYMGDGVTAGGRALVVDEGDGKFSTGNVRGPKQSTNFAMALFDGISGLALLDGPTPGVEGTALHSIGIGKLPIYRLVRVSDLSAIDQTPGHVLLVEDNAKGPMVKCALLPVSSLEKAEKGHILTGNGREPGDDSPSFKAPDPGSFVQIGKSEIIKPSDTPKSSVVLKGITKEYNTYVVVGTGIQAGTAATYLDIRFMVGGDEITGSFYITSGASSTVNFENNKKSSLNDSSAIISPTAQINPTLQGSGYNGSFMMHVFNGPTEGLHTYISLHQFMTYVDGSRKDSFCSSLKDGVFLDTRAITGITFKLTTSQKQDTIAAGTFTLYGLVSKKN